MRTTLILRTLVIGALVATGCAKDSEESATKTTKTSGDENGNSETGGGTGTTAEDPTNATPATSTAPATGDMDTGAPTGGTTSDFIIKPDGGGVTTSVGIYFGDVKFDLLDMYTRGIRFVTGRVDARRELEPALALYRRARQLVEEERDPGVAQLAASGAVAG